MLIPHGSHIMVVDGSRFALFRNKGKDHAPELQLIEQERDIVPRTSEIGTGQPGRGFQSNGGHRSAYEQTDYHQIMEDQFAKHACQKLEAVLEKDDASAILIAAPRVLGMMRKRLTSLACKRILVEIDKDYVGRSPKELATLLANHEH